MKLAQRQAGADLDALETAYRTKVEQCANDNAFYETLCDFIGEFSFTGHLDLWGRRYESELASLRAYVRETGEAEKEPYLEALDNPVSHNTYDPSNSRGLEEKQEPSRLLLFLSHKHQPEGADTAVA